MQIEHVTKLQTVIGTNYRKKLKKIGMKDQRNKTTQNESGGITTRDYSPIYLLV